MMGEQEYNSNKIATRVEDDCSEAVDSARVLAHLQNLEPYLDVIEREYLAEDITLYRWMHCPPIDDDFRPQIFQESNPIGVDDLQCPDVDAPDEVKLEHVGKFTLSGFVTLQDAVDEWKRNLHKRTEKVKDADRKQKKIEKWIADKGQYVYKVDYTIDTAMAGPRGDGVHKQVFLFDGIEPRDLIDPTFEPIKIDIL